jgi:uncharacterized membrane protein
MLVCWWSIGGYDFYVIIQTGFFPTVDVFALGILGTSLPQTFTLIVWR